MNQEKLKDGPLVFLATDQIRENEIGGTRPGHHRVIPLAKK